MYCVLGRYDEEEALVLGDIRGVFDCAPFIRFLADKCPLLYYLHIHFEKRAFIRCDAFAEIPTSVEWLMLSYDDLVVEGLSTEDMGPAEPLPRWLHQQLQDFQIEERIGQYLRPRVPPTCKLCVLKNNPGGREELMHSDGLWMP